MVCVRRSRPEGGRQQVAEWVLSGFGREGEQVGSQGGPGGLAHGSTTNEIFLIGAAGAGCFGGWTSMLPSGPNLPTG